MLKSASSPKALKASKLRACQIMTSNVFEWTERDSRVWRAIMLAGCDYKIVAKRLVHDTKPELANIIWC